MDHDAVERERTGTEWRREGDAIVRDREFADFAEAMAWVNRPAA